MYSDTGFLAKNPFFGEKKKEKLIGDTGESHRNNPEYKAVVTPVENSTVQLNCDSIYYRRKRF